MRTYTTCAETHHRNTCVYWQLLKHVTEYLPAEALEAIRSQMKNNQS